VTFTVDTSAPVAPIISSVIDNVGTTVTLGNGDSTNDTTPSFSGTTEGNALITVYDNGKQIGQIAADGTGSWNYTPPRWQKAATALPSPPPMRSETLVRRPRRMCWWLT
jgi:hypothetical protein